MGVFRTLLFLFSFFFLLMYAGMSIVILGVLTNEPAFIIFGVIWEVVTIFIFLNVFPFKMLVGALGGALFGVFGGALLGMFIGNAGDLMVGVVGGATFGALGGIVIFGIVYSLLLFGWIPIVGPIIGHLLVSEGLPTVVTEVLFVGAILIGVILGINGVREVYPKIFGPIGGMATVGWIVGMIMGVFAGARMFHVADDVNQESLG
ncbi:MAG: hypothetical protein GY797_14155 [Deltaproteobacteria bacterium]|nr:hypothetical protein [Deltaproteobacteria bacterium]